MMKTKKSYQTQRSKTEKTGKQIYGGKKNNGTGKKQLSAIKENHKKTNTGKNNVSYNTWRNMKTVVKYAQTDPRKQSLQQWF